MIKSTRYKGLTSSILMKKNILKVARYLIPFIPKGKNLAIRTALYFGGSKFEDVITVSDGRKFFINNISLVNRHLFFLNQYEDYESNIVKKLIVAGDYVVDVGACFGWYSTLACKLVGSSGRVFAFELVPAIAEELKHNVHLNRLEENITIENVGLAEKDGTLDYHYAQDLGLGNLRSDVLKDGGTLKTGKASVTSLDHYLEKNAIKKVDFIKCDIDGADLLFLRGASNVLSSQKPIVLMEVSGAHGQSYGSSCYDIFQELSRYGYHFFSLHYKSRLQAIEPSQFHINFKENILCLTDDKLHLMSRLR